ncbi:serine/threonine protein kinase [Actinomadura barringtoniae]|uniref:Serine/threonine protein kinase n=1 Tax=Actinomadura barringtoniae TaxID=1427535 RepID=A0A939PDZ6_9ACTN|nr:serine/threonine-protein kinase [Actinomadura barringtoniae]MBO2450568.1 serine/threonine protein kinase [Actinomadura barringtoniae]
MGKHRRLDGHRLLAELGRGSTAVVHLAVDPFGREVALKELTADFAGDAEGRGRLAREIAAQSRVASPYVARLLGGRVGGEQPYVVMQYVPGTPLADLIEAYGAMRGARLLRLARGLALGLAAVHDAGVLHRDVAPGNVMVLGDRPTLIDFGIAQETGAEQLTRRGMVIGTPAYLAPELIEGERATTASDVYAWAATMAYAATGRHPFGRGSLHGVCFRILRGQVDLEGVGEPLASLLRLGLRRDPATRPSARWFAGSLAEWAADAQWTSTPDAQRSGGITQRQQVAA